jgi:hypothetical protein
VLPVAVIAARFFAFAAVHLFVESFHRQRPLKPA